MIGLRAGKRLLALSALFLGVGVSATPAHADEISVAVAANFAEPMKHISQVFEKATGHKVLLSSGSTGKFYAQIKAGGPFAVLLSADDETPKKLQAEGAAVPGTAFTYAIGKLVLWSPKDGFVDGNGDVLKQQDNFQYLAVANPKLAPYGVAAVETLKALGVYDALSSKFVQGENIAQTYQFVATGNAQLGFVALSQVIGPDGKMKQGSMWIVPERHYTPIRQDAILLNKGKDQKAARALLDFLKSDEARKIIQSYGYSVDQTR